MNTLNVYAMGNDIQVNSISSDKIKDELSKNGNVVTQYTNEEDKKLKSIVWAKGVTPPKMGGKDSEFRKDITYVNGEPAYVDYKAPYVSGKGWYDVNKTEDRVTDRNLCFAAAASNALHWWLEQNTNYINQYLDKNPNYPKAQELDKLRDSFKSQQDSEVYKLFVRQFAYKPDGYWADLLADQFINGYYPKKNGGTNDSDLDREKLLTQGPDPKGGFFYDVFRTTLLTKRRNYSGSYNTFANDLKNLLINGDMVLMDYVTGNIAHVVTIWGAEYDLDGKISAVYLSDSDDDKSQGMVRYNVRNSGGKPMLTTRVDGKGGSHIQTLQVLSQGKKIWENNLGISKKTLEIEWGNTEFIYNGKEQKPTVTAKNIENGDDVIVSVQGEQTNVGTYTATAVLSGTDANKYELPKDNTKIFVINKAQSRVEVSASRDDKNKNSVMLKANVFGVNNEKLEGSITFKDGNTVIASDINVSDGVASYYWTNIDVGNHSIIAEFSSSVDGIGKNYKDSISNILSLDISKLDQDKLYIKPVTNKKFGDVSFELETTGGSGSGSIIFKSSDPSIISISGNVATIHKAGTVTITATKSGDKTYNSATATYEINVAKAQAPDIKYPTVSNLVYGEKLSDSALSGGSTQYGSFAWANDDIVPVVNNEGYEIIFTPNSHTLENYETIDSTRKNVKVKVSKANPNVKLTSKILNENGLRKVVLSVSIDKVGYGDNATGTVKFVNNKGAIEGATSVNVENGIATYTWTGMSNELYKVKAIYSGDENYESVVSSEIIVDARKKPQSNFAINEIDSKVYGDKPFILSTNGGNGSGSIIFKSSDPSIISISGNVATIHKAGTVTITATKLGDENYSEAISSIPVVINKKLLTIIAEDKLNIIKGSPMPELTYKVEGLVDGDKFTLIPTLTTELENTNGIGEYEIIVSGSDLTNSESYDIVYVNGKITIVDHEDEVIIQDNINEDSNITPPKNENNENNEVILSNIKPNNNQVYTNNQDVLTDKNNTLTSSNIDNETTQNISEEENVNEEEKIEENINEDKNEKSNLKIILALSFVFILFAIIYLNKRKYFKK